MEKVKVHPDPFISVHVLARLSESQRQELVCELYRCKQEGSGAAKVAMNSIYGQLNYL